MKDIVRSSISGLKEEMIAFLQELVKVPSINPDYPGVNVEEVLGNETVCNRLVEEKFKSLGLETDMWEVLPERSNVVGTLKGAGKGRSLIINAHVDVVPEGDAKDWNYEPFSGTIEKGRIYSRGANDNKQGITAMTWAVAALLKAGFRPNGDVILESAISEETMGPGTRATIERGYKADAAIVAEVSNFEIQTVSSGLLWMGVTVRGKPTHSCMRFDTIRDGSSGSEAGVNAIEKANKIINALLELEKQWGISQRHPLLPVGHSTISPGVIRGAPQDFTIMSPYIIPEYCRIDYAVWYLPTRDVEDVKKEIEDYILAASGLDPWLKEHPPEVEWVNHWPPYLISEDESIVTTLSQTHEQVFGTKPKISGIIAVDDGSFLHEAGIPVVTYGNGWGNPHGNDEFSIIDELQKMAEVFALTILEWCGYEQGP